MHRRTLEAGVSLLEVIAGIVVLALVSSAIAIYPDFYRRRASAVDREAQIETLLERAKMQAMRGGTVTAIVFDPISSSISWGKERLVLADGTKMTLTSAAELAGLGKQRIVFFPDGTSSGAAISISDATGEYHHQISWLTSTMSHVQK